LVLKTDNGSPFGAGRAQDFLRESAVFCLFSPPHTPRYNGVIEASIGSSKIRTESHATREGHPGLWSGNNVAFAQLEANATARPLGPTGPTPDERWRTRPELTGTQRAEFATSVETHRLELLTREGSPSESELTTTRLRLIDREAIRRALVVHGYLLFSRRSLPLPIGCAKTADLS
jgi:hypothetical protein